MALRPRCYEFDSVTPGSYNLVFGTPSGTTDQCFMNRNNTKTFQFYSKEEGEEVIPKIIDGQLAQEVYALDLFEINLVWLYGSTLRPLRYKVIGPFTM